MKNRGVLPIDLTLLGYRHYNYEINLIYILQFSLTVPPSIDIPTTITRIRKVMENQLLSAHSSPPHPSPNRTEHFKTWDRTDDVILNTIACAWQYLALFFSRKKEDALAARLIIYLLWLFSRKKKKKKKKEHAHPSTQICQSRRYYKRISTTGQEPMKSVRIEDERNGMRTT